MDLPNPGIEPRSPISQEDSLSCEPPGKLITEHLEDDNHQGCMGLQPETEIGICEQLTQQMTDAEAETPTLWPPHAKS